MARFPEWQQFLLLFVLFFSTHVNSNQAFDISPIRVELSANIPSAALTFTNKAPNARLFEVEVVSWQRINGEDQYSPSRDLLTNPPVFKVEPGAVQIIRVGLNKLTITETEQRYRIFITEVTDEQTQQPNNLNLLMRLAIPVFIQPKNGIVAKLQWQAIALRDKVELHLHNNGNSHVQIEELMIINPQTRKPVPAQELEYRSHQRIFPGEYQRWLTPVSPAENQLTFEIQIAGIRERISLNIQGK